MVIPHTRSSATCQPNSPTTYPPHPRPFLRSQDPDSRERCPFCSYEFGRGSDTAAVELPLRMRRGENGDGFAVFRVKFRDYSRSSRRPVVTATRFSTNQAYVRACVVAVSLAFISGGGGV